MNSPVHMNHPRGHNHISREEIEARLEASETRMKLAHGGLEHKVDMVLEKLGHIHGMIPDMHAHVSKLRDEVKADNVQLRTDVKSDYSFTRWTIAGIIIAAVGALWVTQANLIAALALVKG